MPTHENAAPRTGSLPPSGPAVARAPGAAPWSLAHPAWQCGFRPFFAAATLLAVVAMLLWAGFLHGVLPLPPAAARVGAVSWHGHGLLIGMGLAAVSGFLLTAVPEFTATPAFGPRVTRTLASCWLAGIGASSLSGPAAIVSAALAWQGLVLGLLAVVLPRLWRDPGRGQMAFAWSLGVLDVVTAGYHVDLWLGQPGLRWPRALLDVYMVLMVVAVSRISMRIVNDAIDEDAASRGGSRQTAVYLARPPRRNLATACIAMHAVLQVLSPLAGESALRLEGWLALAASAAMLNLLNDWHVGRALVRRWPLMLYAVYLSMAAGYALLGAGGLMQDTAWASAGRHVLAVGAFGLGIFAVLTIAGRAHAGLQKDERAWIPAAAALLLLAATARGLSAVGPGAPLPMGVAALSWTGAFGLVLARLAPKWGRPRSDGRYGCAGPIGDGERC